MLNRIKHVALLFLLCLSVLVWVAADIVVTLDAEGIGDQDDMCIWLHPEDPSQSLVITADKDADKLFVYNLDGESLAAHALPDRPGNIDVIYNFPLGGKLVDVVGFNTRSVNNARFGFFQIHPETLELDSIGYPRTTDWSDELYGFALYRSPNNGAFYAFGSDQSSRIQQYLMSDDGMGGIMLEHKRTIQNGSTSFPTEGMVADHEMGLLYAANENQGIFIYGADEDQSVDHIRMIDLSPGMLDDDVEGVTIYYAAGGAGYLIASSQGKNYFSVFDRAGDNAFVGSFRVGRVEDTDGIDVMSASLNETFPLGVFVCHNDRVEPQPVEMISWADIADDLMPALTIDTAYWDPRQRTTTGVADARVSHLALSVFPNPARSQVQISFQLAKKSAVRWELYYLDGRKLATVFSGQMAPGEQILSWNRPAGIDGRGLVIVHLQVGEERVSRKVILT